MQFYEKLDFLMKITNTTNSALAKSVNIDASHVSRLRRGKRTAPKDEACIKSMADYFARNCRADYQSKALSEAMQLDAFPSNDKEVSRLIVRWMRSRRKDDAGRVETFLSGLSDAAPRSQMLTATHMNFPTTDFPKTDMAAYFGVQGKRRAVIYFLSEVLAQDKPRTLLLFSDEDTEWMTADRSFAKEWAALMEQVLLKGNRIIIIHTVSRDLDEMLRAISNWMPLYMSGAIEPYYCPRKKDGIFKRTLFIAPGVSAVTSNSVGNVSGQSANLLFRKHKAVDSFTEEFNQYLRICRPLMRIFTAKDADAYIDTLLEFEKEKSNTILKTESLSSLTMPEEVAVEMIARAAWASDKFRDICRSRTKIFEESLKNNSFTEIIELPDINTVKSGEVGAAFSLMMGGDPAHYTEEEYIKHLENIVRLLNTYENFHVHLTNNGGKSRYMVYAKEEIGSIVANTSFPSVALGIKEINMTAAFWGFLRNIIGDKAYNFPDNRETAGKLGKYIRQLKLN
ncbi:MAG: transcriptional regulator [Clostridia bacterium]|nr:transcriptional regulator [Clostridia bacterium]